MSTADSLGTHSHTLVYSFTFNPVISYIFDTINTQTMTNIHARIKNV